MLGNAGLLFSVALAILAAAAWCGAVVARPGLVAAAVDALFSGVPAAYWHFVGPWNLAPISLLSSLIMAVGWLWVAWSWGRPPVLVAEMSGQGP